jgi:hypothetical protein
VLAAALLLQVATCPGRVGPTVDSAWQAYRNDRVSEAAARFAVADSLCPDLPDVLAGLGFVALRQGDVGQAERRFNAVLGIDAGNADGWYGLGLVRVRQGRRDEAAMAFHRALARAPDYLEAAQQLLGLGDTVGIPPAIRPATPQIPARTHGARFEVRPGGRWQPFYVKGINLGAARPGFFPSEFPTDDSTFAYWIRLIAASHANVVRLYTILPPAFYRMLKRWNDGHPHEALWLVHGVWAELPPQDDYDDSEWKGEFRTEMRRVVDVLHGHAALPRRPGHAFGRYTADVSDHVLAIIIGREWEPFSIHRYNTERRGHTAYAGRFLAVARGTPADVWMAEQCDFLLRYEWDVYHAQRPIAYTNWPTLDPLHHPTEPTLAQESALRQQLGLPPLGGVHEYDNDQESLDAMLVRTTPEDVAGYFAAFHAYPYYPDFMDYDPTYGAARSSYGRSHYFGYLRDLARHHAGRVVLIAEYGVPSSRGVAHLQPEGLAHGGHDETEMAALDVRMTREIREAGLAGGILFSWLDEWFKHNWIVIDLEVPPQRNRLWLNAMDAEQNYGLLGQYAGAPGRGPRLGGDPARWRGLSVLEANSAVHLHVGSDEAYVYLAIETAEPLRPDSTRFLIGLDTYRADLGEFRLPGVARKLATGVEFYLDLPDTLSGQLYVARNYNPYLIPRAGMGPAALDPFYNVDCTVDVRSDAGAFDSMFVTTNRFRVTRAKRLIPATGVNRGRLRYGSLATSTLADWFVDRAAGLVEVRLPWGLLNVTDPSSHTVLKAVRDGGRIETAVTEGMRIGAFALSRRDGAILNELQATETYRWPAWEHPRWHERLKPAYEAMRQLWGTW